MLLPNREGAPIAIFVVVLLPHVRFANLGVVGVFVGLAYGV
jgi:hypothetical protein